jgi:hypothetical protein
MKTNQLLTAILLIAIALISSGGCRDKVFEEITYTANVPVYMDFDEFRGSVKKTAPQQLISPGKIYFKDHLLYINEVGEGIHVIDNSDPSSPDIMAFIEIPGNYDLAIRGSILFADSYIDLVALDISDPDNPVEIDRLENAFPNVLPPMDEVLPIVDLDFTKGVVAGWEIREHTESIERGSTYHKDWISFDDAGIARFGSQEVSLNSNNTGIGGSMARFTIFSDYLYSVHNNALKLFNIGSVPGMDPANEIDLGRLVETIFPYDGKLFLGTTTGMLVYGLANPGNPVFVSAFDHINSCDPVVVQGDYAYVTLRSGTECFGFTNQLDVVDISVITAPELIKSYPMYNPHGLGIDSSVLFICDGDDGLKVYDATDLENIDKNLLAHFPGIKAYDVIPLGGVLMMIGADGLYQYDYTDQDNMVLLSSIPVTRKQ